MAKHKKFVLKITVCYQLFRAMFSPNINLHGLFAAPVIIYILACRNRNKKMKKLIYTIPVLAAFLAVSCNSRPSEGNKLELSASSAEKVTTSMDYIVNSNITLNDMSINAKFDSLLAANKSDRANIVSVKLAEASLIITDSVNTFDRFSDLKLSIFGDEGAVVANKTGIQPSGAKEIKLDVQDKDLYESIKKGEVILLADGNTKGDSLKSDLKTKLVFKLKIEAAAKK
jgi:hypothetical protein